jgi:3-methyladenine DNA glycosylase/8-oxoguanine DNA glycosylase
MIERAIALRGRLDLVRTLEPLAHGRGDRTILLTMDEAWVALRTVDGPATLRLSAAATEVRVSAWGAGAERALVSAPALIGEDDEPELLQAHHPIIRRLQRRHPGLRLPRTADVVRALLPAILEQKVTGTEAFRSYARLLRAHGEPAPGPRPELRLPPSAATIAGLPYHAFHPLGVERRRADILRRAASRAEWLAAATTSAAADARLRSIPGIGPWTSAEVRRIAFGDPDAISVGDYHIPNSVAWALAGEARADDARMLALLEPYRGQRGRVQRLLEVGRITAPRFGPRFAPREIAAI